MNLVLFSFCVLQPFPTYRSQTSCLCSPHPSLENKVLPSLRITQKAAEYLQVGLPIIADVITAVPK